MWAKGEKSSSITAVPVGSDHGKWPDHLVTDNKQHNLLYFLFTNTAVMSHSRSGGAWEPQEPC